VEIFVAANEPEIVPADADSEPEAAARQLVARGRRFATRTACRCAKTNTPTAKPIRFVQPDKKPNNTNGS
jgi:hypothetical protein